MPTQQPTPPALAQAFEIVRQHGDNELSAARLFDHMLRTLVMPFHKSVSWGDRLLTLDKAAAFKEDPRYLQAFAEVNSSTGANQYASPDGIGWRLNTLTWAARHAVPVPGDFIECGVYRGDMSWVVTEMVDLAAANKEFYLYDTFEGFAPQYSSEADFPGAPQLLAFNNAQYKIPQLYESVRDRFSSKPYVKVVKGVVPDILHSVSPSRIAFMHIDMNSPAAEVGALEILFDRVSSGGVLIFDDYGWEVFRKQKMAADEFMAVRNNWILELPTGQGLLVKR